ncbi:hypothetical protein LCGC14_2976140, partial [marine sediment metagenome]
HSNGYGKIPIVGVESNGTSRNFV